MDAYHSLLENILKNGRDHSDRTGVGTRRLLGLQLRHDMTSGFPLITTKEMFFKGTFEELKWFLSGSTSLADLDPSVHKWWKPWADEHGSLGPIYGKQLRSFGSGLDQVLGVLSGIMNDPDSRRLIATTWNPEDVVEMKLPCCHGLVIQFMCNEDGGISMSMYQRSADMFLGVPHNIASYGLLLELIASLTGRYANELVMTFGDAHIYTNHFQVVEEQLSRSPFTLPRIDVHLAQCDTPEEALESLVGVEWRDVDLLDYHCYGKLEGKLAI